MRLLVALDGTDASDDALDYALDIAVRLDASLLFAYVVEPAVRVTEEASTRETATLDGGDETEFVQGALEDARAVGDRILHEAVHRAETLDIAADTSLRDGDPLEELVTLAARPAIDGVIVGHRGVDDHADTIESIAKRLIARSPIPVTVVP
jgi:nucleotide-binding universal stress UspA family protein